MEDYLLKIASTQGIWAALAVVLIFYILRAQEKRDAKQEEREKSYQDIISKLTDKFSIVDSIRNDVEDIKDYLVNKK